MKLDRSCDAVTAVELYIHISLSYAKPASLHQIPLKVAVTPCSHLLATANHN